MDGHTRSSATATVTDAANDGLHPIPAAAVPGLGQVVEPRISGFADVAAEGAARTGSPTRTWAPHIRWPFVLAAFDLAMILVAVVLNRALPIPLLAVYTIALSLMMAAAGMYSAGTLTKMPNRMLSTVGLVTVAAMGIVTLNFMALGLAMSPAGVLVLWFDTTAALVVGRLVARPARAILVGAQATRKTLIIGSGAAAVLVAEQVERHPEMGLETVGFVDHGPRKSVRGREEPLLGDISLLGSIIEMTGAEVVIFGYTKDNTADTLVALYEVDPNVELLMVPRFFQFVSAGMKVEDLSGMPVLRINRQELTPVEHALKRLEDIVLGGLSALLILPFVPFIALAIKLDSPGPVLFAHERVGKRGKPFKMYKFRSMKECAEQDLEALARLAEEDARGLKNKSDDRVTRLGAFLRKASIDELPQLINVLKGDMSLVGPRPAVATEVAEYDEWQKKRLSVAPGITGLWQVSGRSDVAFDERIWLDFNYIDSWSLGLDVSILLKTIPAVISAKGAY